MVPKPDSSPAPAGPAPGEPAGPDRLIPLAGTYNLRDVGGYPARGGTVRWRTLLRSDALHRLDDAGREQLAALHLRTVIDLRTPGETELAPSALGAGFTGQRQHIPVLDGASFATLPPELSAIYRFMIDDCGTTLGAAVRSLARPGALPALIHCSAGKDRTGTLTALVLAAIGVPDEDIAADYALSHTYLLADPDEALRRVRDSTGLGQRLNLQLLGAKPETIGGLLGYVRDQAGSVPDYLRAHGVTSQDLDHLHQALVEPPADG
jgi:protein-tyrosine phosphatase